MSPHHGIEFECYTESLARNWKLILRVTYDNVCMLIISVLLYYTIVIIIIGIKTIIHMTQQRILPLFTRINIGTFRVVISDSGTVELHRINHI